MKRFTALFIAILMLVTVASCSSQTQQQAEETGYILSFTDDLGRNVDVKSADRVAALIGSFADIWCIAGGKDSLVATANDAWTSFDLNLDDSVVNTGGVKEPSLEAILSAEPDFIIASVNTTANVELEDTFKQAGITVAYFDVECFDDYLHMLDICTQITGNRENYEKYGTAIAEEIKDVKTRVDDSHPTVLCIRASGSSCKVKSSTGNLLGEMLADLGCVNIADSDNEILENLSMERIVAEDPDYIFAVLQGSDPTDAQQSLEATLLSNPAWQTLTAVKEGRFHIVENSLYNLKPNARWGYAYEKLADILYG